MAPRPSGCAALFALLVPSIVAAATDGPAPCDASRSPWILPAEAEDPDSETGWATFAWDGFVALCWPQRADGAPGEPDVTSTLCDGPTGRPVFLQWMLKNQLLLPGGASPGTWSDRTFETPTYTPPDGGPTRPLLGVLAMNSSPDLLDEFEEAFSDAPLIDQNGEYVLFQIFVNRSEFEYFSQTGYYDAANQYAAFQPGGSFRHLPSTGQPHDFTPPISLPDYARQGAIELKAAWKQLTPAEADSGRYIMQEVYYASNLTAADPPCGPVMVGLVGLHVMQLTPSTERTFFWSTFEQVDNVDLLPGNPTGVPSFNPGPDASCAPPYENGYSCDGPDCSPSEPGGTGACPPFPPTAGQPPDVCRSDPNAAVNVSRIPEMTTPPEVEAVNDAYRKSLPAPYRYYRLLNTMHPLEGGPCCVPPDENNTVNACYMTNVTMETYTQYYQFIPLPRCSGPQTPALSVNCTDCHALGSPLGAPLADGGPYPDPAYQIFTFLLMDAKNSCPADLNYDRVVDDLDLNLLLQAWGTSGTTDLSGTGVTDGADLGQLLAAWGACASERPAPPPRLAPDRRPQTGFRRLAARVETPLPPRSVGERRPHRP